MKSKIISLVSLVAGASLCAVSLQAAPDGWCCSVPDTTGTLTLLGVAVAGLVAFRRRLHL
ncbi:MAG TPA: VPDSG-CTERM sorting domain-containing protein [Candidatus Didemnitutus sp.]|nr:VPDSG-CTERM sorting domain-containing protein [Candidatus Didemnitutus sp.]